MKHKIIFTAMLCLLPTPAFAMAGAGTAQLVLTFSIPLLVIALTTLGGGYAVIKLSKQKTSPTSLYALAIFVALIFSVAGGGAAVVVALTFVIFAVVRGVQMIVWGVQASSDKVKPDYLHNLNSPKLIISGSLLVVVSIVLMVGSMMVMPMPRSYEAAIACNISKNALRDIATEQEIYFAKYGKYLQEVSQLKDFKIPDGVTIEVIKADNESLILKAWHKKCDRDHNGTPEVFTWDSSRGGLQE